MVTIKLFIIPVESLGKQKVDHVVHVVYAPTQLVRGAEVVDTNQQRLAAAAGRNVGALRHSRCVEIARVHVVVLHMCVGVVLGLTDLVR